jgi:hypothetical protein
MSTGRPYAAPLTTSRAVGLPAADTYTTLLNAPVSQSTGYLYACTSPCVRARLPAVGTVASRVSRCSLLTAYRHVYRLLVRLHHASRDARSSRPAAMSTGCLYGCTTSRHARSSHRPTAMSTGCTTRLAMLTPRLSDPPVPPSTGSRYRCHISASTAMSTGGLCSRTSSPVQCRASPPAHASSVTRNGEWIFPQIPATVRADAQQLVVTRLLDCVHDPVAHFGRLQRIRPRRWSNDNPLARWPDISGTPVANLLRCVARGLFVYNYDMRDKIIAFRHGF